MEKCGGSAVADKYILPQRLDVIQPRTTSCELPSPIGYTPGIKASRRLAALPDTTRFKPSSVRR
jgi:hypothetical protein